jgi:hypothetical protein
MSSLSDSLHAQITGLCQRGDALMSATDIQGALTEYHAAWQLLPEPKEDWEAATWILSAIGDAHFQSRDFSNAVSALFERIAMPRRTR